MNKVILMGRLTRDPDIRYSQGENAMAIARYTLAVDRRGRKDGSSDQTADFISCVSFGKIAEKQLFLLEERYPYLEVDQYVIMPNHIHAIMILHGETAGASPRPTITDIVCAYKSLATRECKKNGFDGKLFQTSFYEHIIRGQEDYTEIVKYIYENPIRWYYDELYAEE